MREISSEKTAGAEGDFGTKNSIGVDVPSYQRRERIEDGSDGKFDDFSKSDFEEIIGQSSC